MSRFGLAKPKPEASTSSPPAPTRFLGQHLWFSHPNTPNSMGWCPPSGPKELSKNGQVGTPPQKRPWPHTESWQGPKERPNAQTTRVSRRVESLVRTTEQLVK